MNGNQTQQPEAPTTEGMTKMDPELKVKWLEALRSGKYDQATGQLCDGIGYCCLGVLCEIVDPDGWDDDNEWEDKAAEAGPVDEYGWIRDRSELPTSFRRRARISEESQARLVEMNDDARMSFRKIADYIEANL